MKIQIFRLNLLILLAFFLIACSPSNKQDAIKIAINPWPGYEFLFLAQEKGFFKELDLNIELIEMSSLADVLRVYSQGRADGMASTMIEVVQAAGLTQEPIQVVQIADYSFGGDTIVSDQSITNIQQLAGKRVGTEIGSLGMYILAQALNKHGLTLGDVDIINVEQLDAEMAMTKKRIDAIVTYPPFSTAILKHSEFKEIFTTQELPGDVIDTISINEHSLTKLPEDWLSRFHQAWDKAIQYSQQFQHEAYGIMAEREGISPEEFADALGGLKLLSSSESSKALNNSSTEANINKVCETLAHAKTIMFSCDNMSQLIKMGR